MGKHSLIALLALTLCIEARAQLVKSASAPRATPPPTQLLEDIIAPNRNDSNCQAKDLDKVQSEALEALGISASAAEDARLLFEDLDGDGTPEALLTVDIGGANVVLVVLKRKGDKWYRLPSPPEFVCWCKYEMSPLDAFVDIQTWSYPFDEGNQPRRLIFVRGSGGGTGVYQRTLRVFALQSDEIRLVFDTTEEDRECFWPHGCDLRHVIVTIENEGELSALVTREFHRKAGLEEDFRDESWWVGRPVSKCSAYSWNAKEFKFESNAAATAAYCKSRPSTHKAARPSSDRR